MSPEERARHIVDQMYDNDAFSQWLGIERLEERPGYAQLRMTVRPEMCNGMNIAHGGITFSLADSAFAFASNGHGPRAVSVETSISHLRAVQPGDVLTATAVEDHLGGKLGHYHVHIHNQDQVLVALFKGTVYRLRETWETEK